MLITRFLRQPRIAALRTFTTFNEFTIASQMRLEAEIRTALAKLSRISESMPDADAQRRQKTRCDLKDLEQQYADTLVALSNQAAQAHLNPDADAEFRMAQELKQKKILTQLKSKYYMLKVNYPQLAERIDSEPINIDEDLLSQKSETVI